MSLFESLNFCFILNRSRKQSRTQPEDSGKFGLRIGSLGTIFPRQPENVKHNTNQKPRGVVNL